MSLASDNSIYGAMVKFNVNFALRADTEQTETLSFQVDNYENNDFADAGILQSKSYGITSPVSLDNANNVPNEFTVVVGWG